MVSRQEAADWIKQNIYATDNCFSDPEILKLCILNGKLEYISLFWERAWNDEVIDVYVNYIKDNNVDINSLEFDGSSDTRKKIINSFLDIGYLNHALKMVRFSSDWPDNYIDKFIDKMDSCIIDTNLFSHNHLSFCDNELVLEAAIKNKQYPIINAFRYGAWTESNNVLFSDIAADFVSKGYDKNSRLGLYDYHKTYIELVKNGIYKYIHRINYSREDCDKILNSEINQDILIDAFDKIKEDREYIFDKPIFRTLPKFLKKVLETKDSVYLRKLNFFDNKAWTEENIHLYADNILDDNMFVGCLSAEPYCLSVALDKKYLSNLYLYRYDNSAWTKENMDKYFRMFFDDELVGKQFVVKNPYFQYKICYFDSNYNYYFNHSFKNMFVSNNVNINDDVLKDPDLLYSLGKKVLDGQLSINTLYDKLFSFVYETQSYKTLLLIRNLLDDKLENLNELFDGNGITNYFYEYLLFDQDYRNYCLKNSIDLSKKCSNKLHLQYLLLATKYPELSKYIYISPENVNDYFDDNGIKEKLLETLFTPKSIELLGKLSSDIKEPHLSDKKKFVVDLMNSIQKEKIRKPFFNYIYPRFNDLNEEKIQDVYNLVKRIEYSNSSEVREFGEIFADLILECDNPAEKLEEVEKIFLQNNIPFVGKIYSVFKRLHPDYNWVKLLPRLSPTLLQATDEEKDKIIFSDLLRIELGSNNRNLQQYLVSLFNGNMFYELIRDEKRSISSLSESEWDILTKYAERISFLCSNLLNIDFDKSSDPIKQIALIENKLSNSNNNFTSIPDYLVSNICKDAGFNTLLDILSYSVTKPQVADSLHRRDVNSKFELMKGDYVKGIRNLNYLPNILQNGSVAVEFLGDSASNDCTPLDTDLSLIAEDGLSIKDAISKTEAKGYGSTYLVLKGNMADRIDVTRSNDMINTIQKDKRKIEVFNTGGTETTHYGIRTGFASSEIDYIISSSDFDRIGLEIAMNGFYIPVVDMEGNLKFSPDDYDRLKKQMDGLSHYGMYTYKLSNNLVTDDILMVCSELDNNKKIADEKRKAIYNAVGEVLNDFGISLKTYMDGDLTNGTMEILDTGSTGRGTNVADDSDFDFIVRIDRETFFDDDKMNSIKRGILKKFYKQSSGDFRLENIYLDGLEDPLKIDMTFITKTNKLDYATENCIQDRLEMIRELYTNEYKYVVANIVFAKKFFKEAECYKPKHAGVNPQGGLGGVGTENWILQHGGSFYDAAVDFVNTAEKYPLLEDFQRNYMIQDFGKNHLAEKRGHYPYDNFVWNLNENGFEKMKEVLKSYVNENSKASAVVGSHK